MLAVATLYIGRFLFMPDAVIASWLHGPILVVHEAGHIVGAPFGRFVMLMGGTVLQIALPLAFAVYFGLSRQPFSAALVLLWTSFALVDAAVYVADAQERALPLITFDRDTHDWWNLLLDLRLLHRDDLLAALLHAQAFAVLAAGIALGVIAARPDTQPGSQPGSQPSAPGRPASRR